MLAYDRVQLPELGNQRSTILCQLFHLQAGFLVVDVVLETENSFVSGKNREKSRELSFFHLPLWLYQKMEYIRRKFKGSHYCARINLCDVIKLSHGALGNSRSWCGGHGEIYCQYKAKTELFFPCLSAVWTGRWKYRHLLWTWCVDGFYVLNESKNRKR